MLKFMVVLYKRPGLAQKEFRRHLQEVHGPLAKALPGVRKYIQNYVVDDPKRAPAWDAIIELYFDDWRAWKQHGRVRKARPPTRIFPLLPT